MENPMKKIPVHVLMCKQERVQAGKRGWDALSAIIFNNNSN